MNKTYVTIEENLDAEEEWALVYESDGKLVEPGAKILRDANPPSAVTGFMPPRHSGSTGRIEVRHPGALYTTLYYPSVFKCKIIKRK